ERCSVLRLHGNAREVTDISPRYQDVLDALASGAYDAWHFGGHGSEIRSTDLDADLWPLELEDHPLSPEDLGSEAANLGIPRPFIFFNGCNMGRSGRSLAGMGG